MARARPKGDGAVRFEVKGFDEMRATMQALADRMPKTAAKALIAEAKSILRTAQREHVPVDSKALRDSGRVKDNGKRGREIEVSIEFGGTPETAAYAVAVHEHLSEHSPLSWKMAKDGVTFNPVGHGPKYLEKPLRAAQAGFAMRVGQRLGLNDKEARFAATGRGGMGTEE